MEASAERSGIGGRTGASRGRIRPGRRGRLPLSERWRNTPAAALPETGELHVFRVPLEAPDPGRALGIRARELIAEMLGVPPDEVSLDDPASELHVDSARAGSMGIVAVHRGAPVGVDVRPLRPVEELDPDSPPFSRVELETLGRLPPGLRAKAFVQCRTRKEALLRACRVPGDGAPRSLPLQDIDVALTPGAPARIHRWRSGNGRPEEWTLVHLRPAPGLIGAAALRCEPAAVRLWSVTVPR